MIFIWLGGVLWASTSYIVLRFVGEPIVYRRVIRRRLRTPDVVAPHRTTVTAPASQGAAVGEHEVLATALDAMARELRLGSSLHAAVIAAFDRHPVATLEWLVEAAQRGDALGSIIHERLSTTPDDQGTA